MIVRAEKQTLLEYLSLRLAASKDSLVGSMPFEVLAVVRNGVGIGARVVGILEDEYGPGADAAMLSMTRKQCRWL